MVVSLPPSLRTAALACSARLVVSRAFCTPCSVHLHSETYVGINPPPRVSVPRSTPDYKRDSDAELVRSLLRLRLEVDSDAAAEACTDVEQQGGEQRRDNTCHRADRRRGHCERDED